MRVVLSLFLICLSNHLLGQGINTEFGQNRVQEKKIAYSLQQDNIEIVYYEGGEDLARIVFEYTLQQLPDFENRLNYNLSNGIRIVVFNHFIDYQNSNINLTNPQQYAGGYSTLTDNTSSIYFSGSRIDLYRQTRRAIAEILVSEFIYGGDIQDRIQTAALLSLPDWYYKGLVNYLAESWNIEKDNYLKDFLLSGKASVFTSLQEEDEVLAGHSIWRYVEEKFGAGSVGNVVFITRVGHSVESAFNYYTGLTINSMLKDWELHYKDKYFKDENTFKLPRGQENVPSKLVKKRITQFKLSPDGKKIAIVTNTKGRYQVVLYEIRTRKTTVLLKGGHQFLNQKTVYGYPIIAWENKGKHLTVITFKDNSSHLISYSTDGRKTKDIELTNIPIINDFNYNNDGDKIVMSIIRKSQSDIVVYNLKTKEITDITNDGYDDMTPRFTIDNASILFSSNRIIATNTASNYFSVFEYILSSGTIHLIAGSPQSLINYYQPIELQNNYISFLSDANGIVNNYAIKRNDNRIIQLTNYKRSILYNDVAPEAQNIADLIFYRNKYRIYVGELSENIKEEEIDKQVNTAYRIWLNESNPLKIDTTKKGDSLLLKNTQKDSTKTETKKVFISGFTEKEDIRKDVKISEKAKGFLLQPTQLNFGVNYFLQQFDNSILNNYLYPANVNEMVFNYPMLNILIQTKITDNLNNYQIEAGIRIPFTVKASDYFIRYTSLRGRWDKSLAFFRKGRVFDNERTSDRMVIEQLRLTYSYPFNQRSKINLYTHLRQDRLIALATDTNALRKDITGNIYFGGGIEYVYDNIKSRGFNTFEGLRFKLYSDNYSGTLQNAVVSNNGFDGRYYLKVHRQIYLASRLSGAFSLAPQKTAYYLGGVENEIGYAKSSDNFNYAIPTLNGVDYSFQTIVSPMRGFLRNTRGGSNFVLMNAELRMPIITYLIQKPITSDFLRSLMIVGFVDIGTAWQGKSPYDISNPFNTRIVKMPNYYITVVSRRDPMLYATGAGIRAKILGHYIKVDYGWGYIEKKFQKPITNISLGLDF
ncbi:MAG: hypothetical protein V4613_06090 [Bacteroidota bacterium]